MPRLALGDLTATRSPSKHKDSVEPHIKTEAGAGSSQNDGWQSMRTPRLGARGALASARDGSVSARSPLVQGPPSARSRELDSTAPWMAPQDTFYTPRGSAAWSSASKPSTVHATPRAMTARSSVAGMCSDLERQAHEVGRHRAAHALHVSWVGCITMSG